jgi:phosphoribosylanthranilate isomerase
MPVHAKICGLSTQSTLDAAIAGGASHVGFVFFAPSPRNLEFGPARALAERVPHHVRKVGVFVDPDDALLDAAIASARHDPAPRQGNAGARRPPSEGAHRPEMWKAVSIRTAADLAPAAAYRGAADRILYDAKTPDAALCPAAWGCVSTGGCLTVSRTPCPGRCRAGSTPAMWGRPSA